MLNPKLPIKVNYSKIMAPPKPKPLRLIQPTATIIRNTPDKQLNNSQITANKELHHIIKNLNIVKPGKFQLA